MRDPLRGAAWVGAWLMLVGVATAEEPGNAKRCHAALKRRYASLFKDASHAPVFVDSAHAVDVQVAAVSGQRHELRSVGHCAFGEMEVPQGKLPLPAGWLAVDEDGTDSHVGVVLDARDHELLHYDIGEMTGAYASEPQRAMFKSLKQEEVAGIRLHYGLKGRDLVMTLDPDTNFWGAAASEREMAPLLAFVRGLKTAADRVTAP